MAGKANCLCGQDLGSIKCPSCHRPVWASVQATSAPANTPPALPPSSTPAPMPPSAPSKAPSLPSNIADQAIGGDRNAILTMIQQFIPQHEKVLLAEYLGTAGMFGYFGEHSFGFLTDRRVASIRLTRTGEVVYQDGYLEFLNSSVVYQPSLYTLYWIVFWLVILALPTFGITLLMLPFARKMYYSVKKSGVVFVVKEGVSVYFFTDRKRLQHVNAVLRTMCKLREDRITALGVNP